MAPIRHPHSDHMPAGQIQYQTLDQLSFDMAETHILTIARLFFVSFHHPKSQAWMSAIFTSEDLFGEAQGAKIAAQILQTVNSVRHVRRSGFSYCDPNCEDCAQFVTKEERYLVLALHCLRRGKLSDARTQAMLLCQGGDYTQFMGMLGLLVKSFEEEEASE
ncbi:MAG: hypothetical protein OSA51_13155 [Octadecabacter sp.]|nr:hypothetical protein [Octadecabacter sp.]